MIRSLGLYEQIYDNLALFVSIVNEKKYQSQTFIGVKVCLGRGIFIAAKLERYLNRTWCAQICNYCEYFCNLSQKFCFWLTVWRHRSLIMVFFRQRVLIIVQVFV